jgi:Domain of unknown function (DUF4388)
MALEGSLADMSLSDLFQIFLLGEKSGILSMTHANEHGLIYVLAGKLTDASVMRDQDHRAIVTGEAAVLYMLQWQQASFIFTHNLAVAQRPVAIHHSSNWLVLESLRRQKLPPTQGTSITLETCVEPGATANSTEIGMGLDLDQWRILDRVSARITLAALARDIRIESRQVIDLVTELVATGLLQVVSDFRVVTTLQTQAARGSGVVPQGAPPPPKAGPRLGSVLLQAIQRRVRAL